MWWQRISTKCMFIVWLDPLWFEINEMWEMKLKASCVCVCVYWVESGRVGSVRELLSLITQSWSIVFIQFVQLKLISLAMKEYTCFDNNNNNNASIDKWIIERVFQSKTTIQITNIQLHKPKCVLCSFFIFFASCGNLNIYFQFGLRITSLNEALSLIEIW